MKVIIKRPGQRPEVSEIASGYQSIKAIIGGWFERAMTGPDVFVYCDEDGLSKDLPMNLVRPSDGSAIVGTVVAVGVVGDDERSLTERETALWLATLSVIGVDDEEAWRESALEEFEPLIHVDDRQMYSRIADKAGFWRL